MKMIYFNLIYRVFSLYIDSKLVKNRNIDHSLFSITGITKYFRILTIFPGLPILQRLNLQS